MPPSKRKQRRSRATDLQLDESDVEMPDSSPTRPSAKKRKVSPKEMPMYRDRVHELTKYKTNPRSAKKPQPALPEPIPPQDTDVEEEEIEEISSNDLMEKVISFLGVSKEPINVARQHANDLSSSSQQPVSAFAKISGRDWTYYVREQTINIGRPPDDRQMPTTSMPGASSPIQDLKDQFPVHIDLGPSKIVSRHHASIFYDADWPADEGGWHVRVNGRNGVRVNKVLLRRGARQQIKSGTVLEIAGTQLMFVTPGDKVELDPYFVERAEAAELGHDVSALGHGGNATQSENEDVKVGKSDGNELPGYHNLAPAPPNYMRASTPPQGLDPRSGRGVFDSKSGQLTSTSPMYGRGMMMESTQEIDYSRDAAKDLKPPYSYAHMIAQAIFSSEDQKLTLSNIYSFIAEKYAFYRHSNSGWQNSIRHNLSLNKAFQKVPRRTDEPGKGMKWQIAPEHREEYWKKQQRRVGTSSNPSSPASNKDINPNFRGANGQNLGYDTTMVYQFPAKDIGNLHQAPKLNMSFPPFPPNPAGYTGASHAVSASQPNPTSTPQRRRTNTADTNPALDDSPLPTHFPSSAPRPTQSHPYYSVPTSQPHPSPHLHSPTTQNPTLSSSYLDTPFHPSLSQHTLSTPAPLRQNPKLAPPSTLVAPSKFMPESSPAGPGLFWKGFLGGMTPGPNSAIPPDLSPVKPESDRRNGLGDRDVMSSSPPPMDDGPMSGSPSKPARGRGRSSTLGHASAKKESGLFDNQSRANGGLSTTQHAPEDVKIRASSTGPTLPPASALATDRPSLGPAPKLGPGPTHPPALFQPQAQAQAQAQPPSHSRANSKNDKDGKPADDDDEGGFDLARGFAPIGSSLQRSGGVRS